MAVCNECLYLRNDFAQFRADTISSFHIVFNRLDSVLSRFDNQDAIIDSLVKDFRFYMGEPNAAVDQQNDDSTFLDSNNQCVSDLPGYIF